MISEDLLLESRSLLYKELRDMIISMETVLTRGTLKLILKKKLVLHVRFNNYGQYSYSVLFSSNKLDRVRYDNFDEKWPVATKPHHCHPRYRKNAIESVFTGVPSHHMPKLNKLIQTKKIYSIR